jgi:Tfp pilus assembly protein PilW
MKNKNNKQRGFTIIETMIAVSLFIVVVTIGMGALLNANLIHKKSSDVRSIMDNLSFIMDDMARNLRTGYSYHCIDDLTNLINLETAKSGTDCVGIAFEQQDGDPVDNDDQWVYYVDASSDIGQIMKSTKTGPLATTAFPLTPEEVDIDSVSGFSISGAESGDDMQPFVTIRLVGSIDFKGAKTPFSLQTSVSQRKIDNI